MQEKVNILILYAVIGLSIGLWPLFINESMAFWTRIVDTTSTYRQSFLWKATIGTIATIISIAILVLSGFSGVAIISVIVISSTALWRPAIRVGTYRAGISTLIVIVAGIIALCFAAPLIWWRRRFGLLSISIFELVAVGIVTTIVARFLHQSAAIEGLNKTPFGFKWIAGFTLIAAHLSFSTGIFGAGSERLWHHWGAYVGPAELLLSGAAIFSDFPAQYGLGPTVLIATVCGGDCWHGMYLIAATMTLLFSILICALAFGFSQNHWRIRLTFVVVSISVCFFWTAIPPSVVSPLLTPSVSGIRFLPALLITSFLFFSDRIENNKIKMLGAHLLWMLGALWSPESAFYVTLIWWPYYLFIHRGAGDFKVRAIDIGVAGSRLLGMAIGLVFAVCVLSQLVYGKWPTVHGFLAYALYPPGPLPINPTGAVWFFLLTVALGIASLWQSWKSYGDSILFRRGFLVLLLCYGVFSYFLGRSHDNNLLNIMPFIMLVLVFVMANPRAIILSTMSTVLLASLLGWMTIFGWNKWNSNLVEGRFFHFGSVDLLTAMSFTDDAGHAVQALKTRFNEPVTVLDSNMDVVRTLPFSPWSAIHGPANFAYIPSSIRQEFLKNTAKTLNRPGWLIINKSFPANEWLEDFDAAYVRVDRVDFGTYFAIRYAPKAAGQ